MKKNNDRSIVPTTFQRVVAPIANMVGGLLSSISMVTPRMPSHIVNSSSYRRRGRAAPRKPTKPGRVLTGGVVKRKITFELITPSSSASNIPMSSSEEALPSSPQISPIKASSLNTSGSPQFTATAKKTRRVIDKKSLVLPREACANIKRLHSPIPTEWCSFDDDEDDASEYTA